MNKTRLEAFSDGVLAIIITIMVLELKTPESTDWEEMKAIFPTLGSYALSFVFIGIYWGNHHHLLHTVKKVNSKIIWANMHLLFWLSLIPFATRWIEENHFDKISVAVFGSLLFISGLAYFILQQIIVRHHHFQEKMKEAMNKATRKGLISTVLYLISIFAAFIHPYISEVLFVLVAILWLVPDKNIEKALEE